MTAADTESPPTVWEVSAEQLVTLAAWLRVIEKARHDDTRLLSILAMDVFGARRVVRCSCTGRTAFGVTVRNDRLQIAEARRHLMLPGEHHLSLNIHLVRVSW